MATLQNVTARDFMSANLVSFSADMDVLTAIQLLLEKGCSAGPCLLYTSDAADE